MRLTPEEIRRRGLEALRRELGRAGLVRFLQQFELGEDDYSRQRREWVDRISLEDIASHLPNAGRRRKPG